MTITLRPATEADVPAMARVGCAAFDPKTSDLIANIFPERLGTPGRDDAHLHWRAARKSGRLHDPGSITIVAVDDDPGADPNAADLTPGEKQEGRRLVGLAWYTVPGSAGNAHATTGASEAELQALGETFPPEMDREAMQTLRKRLVAGEESVFGKGAPRKHYELEILAVDPRYGRRGIGRRLVQWGLDKAAQERRDLFVIAAPAGKPLYVTCGFQELASITIWNSDYALMIARNNPDVKVMGDPGFIA